MAGMFAMILMLATFLTGILWFLEKFRWKPIRQRKVEEVRKQTNGQIDGKVLAKIGMPKGWVDSLASFFPVLFVVFFTRSFIYEPFQIPSGSMMPTLLIGDFIAVQKFSYGIKNPLTNATLIPTSHPRRGDVAVFKAPSNPNIDFVKRVVGIPGDKIVYHPNTKKLEIYPACETDGTLCQRQQSIPLNLNYSITQTSEWKEVFGQRNNAGQGGVNFYTNKQYNNLNLPQDDSVTTFELQKRQETLGQKVHDILLLPVITVGLADFYRQSGQEAGQWVVPEGHYFMMGDNRDNSDDSRFWGFVPEQNFVGKVSAIWLSIEKQPDEWPTGIRFNQIGLVH